MNHSVVLEQLHLYQSIFPSDDLVEKFESFILTHDNFYSRHCLAGHVTVSAFVTSGDKVLLIFHPKLKKWIQPGGHCEEMDKCPLDVCQRELKEEVGIEFNKAQAHLIDLDIHKIPATATSSSHLHYDLRYHISMSDKFKDRMLVSSEGLSMAWVNMTDLMNLTSDDSVIKIFQKLFSNS